MTRNAASACSTKIASRAPRLVASMPTAPIRHKDPGRRPLDPRRQHVNSVSRRRSLVGRVSSPRGMQNPRPVLAGNHSHLFLPGKICRPSTITARDIEMRAWSLPLGRWFGVHLRIHYFFLLLLLFCLLSTNFSGISAWRGIFLWFLLFGAVLGREAARAMTRPGTVSPCAAFFCFPSAASFPIPARKWRSAPWRARRSGL